MNRSSISDLLLEVSSFDKSLAEALSVQIEKIRWAEYDRGFMDGRKRGLNEGREEIA